MQVLKFGGSSVSNAENMNKVLTIVGEALKKDKTVLVVSALGGITDTLISSAMLAAAGDETYKERLLEVEQRHMETVKGLIPVTQQSSVLSMVKKTCNEIEDICNGIFLLNELSARTKDRMVSYGELLSSRIIAGRFKTAGFENEWVDSRLYIKTNDAYGNAAVDFCSQQ